MKTPPKVIVAAWDDELTDACDQLSEMLRDVAFQAAPGRTLSALNGAAVAASALVLEIDLTRPDAVAEMKSLADSFPDRKIIAATRSLGGDGIRQLFKAGAADVLTPPFTPESVRTALREILRTQGPPSRGGAVVAVLGAGGGAGATTVALGLASLLARGEARREAPEAPGAALLDFDLQFGDCAVGLNLEPRSTLVDVLEAEARFDDRFLESVLVDHGRGLKVLAPSPTLLPLEALRGPLAESVISAAARLQPHVVVDLPAVWTEATVAVLHRAELMVLVATPTVAGVLHARRVLAALAAAQVATPVFFVLNRVAGVVDAFERPARIARALQVSIDATLSQDAAVPRAQDRGELVVDAFGTARFSRELRALAAKVRRQLAEPAVPARPALTGEAA